VAALAYLFLPISGSIAFFGGRRERVRRHGLQAILLGALWPGAMYVCSAISPGATQAAFLAGGLVWVTVMLAAAFGVDLWLPGVSGLPLDSEWTAEE
jgi:predicted phage tail protein